MGKDIDTTGVFATSALGSSCLPGPSVGFGIQTVTSGSVSFNIPTAPDVNLDTIGTELDFDLSADPAPDLSGGLDLDLSEEGLGYVDSAVKDATTQPFNPETDRVTFQAGVPPGLKL